VEEQYGFAECRVAHVDDLYAGKMCAALDRQHPRDFFDVKCLMEAEGISDDLMEVFIVYLISSNQPVVKLLAPNLINLGDVYRRQFAGMTFQPVSLQALESTRLALTSEINRRLTDAQRRFLMGFKAGTPDWRLLNLDHIEELPSVRWKMLNLEKMAANDRCVAVAKLHRVLFHEAQENV
jgi:hypothetical protein